MQDLFRTLPVILEKFGDDVSVRQTVVFAAWRKAAGEMLTGHTVPVSCEEKRLTIAVSGKAWKRHLEDLSGELIFKINRLIGSETVTFIEFIEDPETVKAASKRPEFEDPFQIAEAEITPELRQAANAINDMEMRRKFLLAAGSCIAREKRLEAKEE
jgi:hypothetical protein